MFPGTRCTIGSSDDYNFRANAMVTGDIKELKDLSGVRDTEGTRAIPV